MKDRNNLDSFMLAIKEKLVALANTRQVHLGFRVARRHVNVKAGKKMTNDFEGVHLAIKLLLSMYPPQHGAKRNCAGKGTAKQISSSNVWRQYNERRRVARG